MRQYLLDEIEEVTDIIEKLVHQSDSPLSEDQLTDVNNIQSALELLRMRVSEVGDTSQLDDRMHTLHELTGPINGIVGYLFILNQDYDDNFLTQEQREYVKCVDKRVHNIYQHISSTLLQSSDE